jgi:hypothetical protein
MSYYSHHNYVLFHQYYAFKKLILIFSCCVYSKKVKAITILAKQNCIKLLDLNSGEADIIGSPSGGIS